MRFEPQMIKIVEWVNKLSELDIDHAKVEVESPLSSRLPLRRDVIGSSLSADKALANAPENLQDMYLSTRTRGFGEEVKRRIILGTFALSSGYYDAYYLKAEKTRSLITQEFQEAFSKVDFILTPTTPEPAFLVGAKEDSISMYHCDRFTVPVNLAGLPALSLPVGLNRDGLPVGSQIIGNFFQESFLLKLAFLLEKKVRFNRHN